MATRISALSWLGLGVMALFAGVLLLGGLDGLWFAARHERALATVLRYEPTTRVISEREVLPRRSGGTVEQAMTRTVPVLAPVLRFQFDGHDIEFTAMGLSMAQPYPIGGQVPVHFERAHPEAALLADHDWGIGGAVIQLVTGLLVGVLAVSVYRVLQGKPPVFLRQWPGFNMARDLSQQ